MPSRLRVRPIGVDLFAGAGGMSLGFEQAGFDVVAAVEVDPIHSATHKFNFPNCAVICGDVRQVSANDIRSASKIGDRRVDVVFGGAPCQGFSMIGQRAIDDPRNSLVKEFVRLVTELDARYFVFENVKGLTIGKHRAFLDQLVEAFQDRGYEVRLPWQVLNAVNFGVPQDRERLFLLGAKRGETLPAYPNQTTKKPLAKTFLSLPDAPTCKDALGDLPDAETYTTLEASDSVKAKWGKPSPYAAKLRCLTNDAFDFGYPRTWNADLLTSSMRSEHTAISRKRFLATAEGTVEPISRFFKLAQGGVANTLRAGTDSARGAFTSPRPIHYKFARCITVREMARLHGFPDWFRLHVTKWHGARQIGNSVPPPLARAVAGMVIAALKIHPQTPTLAIELGNTALLSFDMKAAAAFWDVNAPIGKRDRKSGIKKRKQSEIENALAAE